MVRRRPCGESSKRRKISCPPIKYSSVRFSDDELTEIFVRLPVKDVHRFKCVSKTWQALISNYHFGKHYIKFNRSLESEDSSVGCSNSIIIITNSLLVIQTVTYLKIFSTYGVRTIEQGRLSGCLLSDATSMVVPKPGYLGVSSTHAGDVDDPRLCPLPLDQYVPGFRESDPDAKDLLKFHLCGVSEQLMLLDAQFNLPRRQALYVINPVTRNCTKLPALRQRIETTKRRNQNYTQSGDLGFAYDPLVGEFTVVNVARDVGDVCKCHATQNTTPIFHIQVFTSSWNNWRVFTVPCPSGFQQCKVVSPEDTRMVFSKGCFYWTGENGVVSYDPFNEPNECGFIKLPENHYFARGRFNVTITCDGQLRLYSYYGRTFSLWELMLNGNNWSSIYQSTIPIVSNHMSFGCFSPIDAEKVYFVDERETESCASLYLLDMKNGSFREAFTTFQRHRAKVKGVLPLAATWPTPLAASKVEARVRIGNRNTHFSG